MEKVCEFCMALRPAVYCQADAALLCLSCDLRVHSANALSNRHPRSLLCDSCRARPASVRCEDHRMYMCRTCDRSLHSNTCPGSQQQHRKRAINSYIGCPSAKDFAALWDLDLNEQRDATTSAPAVSSSRAALDSRNASSDALRNSYQQHTGGSSVGSVASCTTSVHIGMPNSRSKNQQSNKRSLKGQQQQQNQSSRFILQQIFDLNRLQLDEGNCYYPLIHGEDEKNIRSLSGKAMGRINEEANDTSEHIQDLESEFLPNVSPLEELRSEGFTSPFSSLENIPSSSTAGVAMLGDPFWQQASQFMSQNIQDLGLCEDLICSNDFNNIPDLGVTFQSFDELFGEDEDHTRGLLTCDFDLSNSSVDAEISLDKCENSQAPKIEDPSAASSMYLDSAAHTDSNMSAKQLNRTLRSSYSALSLSSSQEIEGDSREYGTADLDAKEKAVMRYRDKKKTRLNGEKTRQELDGTAVRKRARSRSNKMGRNPDDDISTRSY